MKNKIKTFFIPLIVSVLMLSACGKSHHIKNLESQPVPSNIKTSEEVKKSIILAGSGLGWTIKDDVPGKLLKGSLIVRNHNVIISIPYSSKEYSLLYKSSINMNYDAANGTIHKNYNKWIKNLNDRIQMQLIGL